jgi:hypothetical protein
MFRIGHDGTLDFVHTYDVGNDTIFWRGMVQL